MTAVGLGILIALLLGAVLLVPYLYEEIHKGKESVSARIPDGTGDPRTARGKR